jgi:hypothetical protein
VPRLAQQRIYWKLRDAVAGGEGPEENPLESFAMLLPFGCGALRRVLAVSGWSHEQARVGRTGSSDTCPIDEHPQTEVQWGVSSYVV